ncbi:MULTISPECIES: flagellar hook-basal body complex protein FliE [unclassified Pseudodesulfovibrio]|uniref:flagellar hook-basal body complex protein FliE n=1 Tax=unclassified Pseudodesulfovibrio TaxID=2661612 RepID=UPI000FEB9AD6|nr:MULTISPECIES: flagellar hook-basal body complex protein FliE [unclassified Pseudodesulfovibrio]MCJ2165918.1 flagellar hook-basal body complex protein FliE [Pseudodesulfovibrio sp. S3-i]RWU02651.1 flagellar hook-basal body complex protein FliE [Pseudodesulfovibrio sp. S3]
MVIKSVAINAYQSAMDLRRRSVESTVSDSLRKPQEPVNGFDQTLKSSLEKVNDLQSEKKVMIEEFASGKTQNVHELMITMQKAGMAMQMTGAIRSKIMTSYKEIMQMPF